MWLEVKISYELVAQDRNWHLSFQVKNCRLWWQAPKMYEEIENYLVEMTKRYP
jgi:hypothetical protein